VPDVALFRRTMIRWGHHQPRRFPWRASRAAYDLLIGEVLLQRTRGENVVPVFEDFLRRWPTASDLARARVSSIASVIRPLGLTKRAPRLKELGKALEREGGVPRHPQELLGLPGVGPYAAHAVPVFAFNRNLPLVDWVIARVLRRYFGLPGDKRPNSDHALWDHARTLAGRRGARELWLGTLDFAAAVCKPRPECPTCPLASTCAFAGTPFRQAKITRV
jgi:A/G-specific adenine glycosylase